MKCGRTKRGWYCKRDFHMTGPCALVPRWWNIVQHARTLGWWIGERYYY